MIHNRWEEVPQEVLDWLRMQRGNISLMKTDKGEIYYVAGEMPFLTYRSFIGDGPGYMTRWKGCWMMKTKKNGNRFVIR